MDSRFIYELIGYLASALVAASLTMGNIVRLRIINLAGAVTFTVYGALIQAYPVAAVNLFIVFINLFHLSRMLRAKEFFKVLEIDPKSEYLRYFLDFHAAEIRQFFPGFSYQPGQKQLAFFVLRDMVPAGLFIGDVREDGSLLVRLDFAIPSYRDFKIGRYLYGERPELFRAKGVRELISTSGHPAHAAYLRKMGFVSAAGGEYRRALT
jgi:hypothetical protein